MATPLELPFLPPSAISPGVFPFAKHISLYLSIPDTLSPHEKFSLEGVAMKHLQLSMLKHSLTFPACPLSVFSNTLPLIWSILLVAFPLTLLSQAFSHTFSSQSSLFDLNVCLYHLSISWFTHATISQCTPTTVPPIANLPYIYSLLSLHSTLTAFLEGCGLIIPLFATTPRFTPSQPYVLFIISLLHWFLANRGWLWTKTFLFLI